MDYQQILITSLTSTLVFFIFFVLMFHFNSKEGVKDMLDKEGRFVTMCWTTGFFVANFIMDMFLFEIV